MKSEDSSGKTEAEARTCESEFCASNQFSLGSLQFQAQRGAGHIQSMSSVITTVYLQTFQAKSDITKLDKLNRTHI